MSGCRVAALAFLSHFSFLPIYGWWRQTWCRLPHWAGAVLFGTNRLFRFSSSQLNDARVTCYYVSNSQDRLSHLPPLTRGTEGLPGVILARSQEDLDTPYPSHIAVPFHCKIGAYLRSWTGRGNAGVVSLWNPPSQARRLCRRMSRALLDPIHHGLRGTIP